MALVVFGAQLFQHLVVLGCSDSPRGSVGDSVGGLEFGRSLEIEESDKKMNSISNLTNQNEMIVLVF